ncbi:SEFIR domain-containing protein [Actinophytocola glycyrrhizae]|uniref:SEFIR domain-containing protein n=1 Tax=Actinophytocola glycyrrhizae TaxID=2044873 RepID=A0ABV9RUK5_9PSEU
MARVFVSYARQDARHGLLVGRLCEFLHGCGVEVRLDELAGYDRRDWSLWAIEEILAADFVAVVASANYRVRAEGVLPPGSGDGVAGEAAFLRDRLAYDRRTWQRKILPVVLPGGRVDEIPLFLLPYSSSRYEVTAFTREGTAPLLRALGLPTPAISVTRLPSGGSQS